jgi:hypothetical protein
MRPLQQRGRACWPRRPFPLRGLRACRATWCSPTRWSRRRSMRSGCRPSPATCQRRRRSSRGRGLPVAGGVSGLGGRKSAASPGGLLQLHAGGAHLHTTARNCALAPHRPVRRSGAYAAAVAASLKGAARPAAVGAARPQGRLAPEPSASSAGGGPRRAVMAPSCAEPATPSHAGGPEPGTTALDAEPPVEAAPLMRLEHVTGYTGACPGTPRTHAARWPHAALASL